MRRVLVIGCSGAGKSTFAGKLSARTGVPLTSLDAEFWQPGWVIPPRAEWRAKVAALAALDAWIMDGTFDGSLDLRLPRADTVVWFRQPRWLCLARLAKRVASSYGRVRPEMAPGCPERVDLEFLHYVWNFEHIAVPSIETMLRQFGQHIDPVIIRRDADAQRFLDDMLATVRN